MPDLNKDDYTAEELKRYEEAYARLLDLILSNKTDAEAFRRALKKALAAGFPIDWQDNGGWTLLHWAVNTNDRIKSGLPQIIIEAGAEVNVLDHVSRPPLSIACWNYITDAAPAYLQAVGILLAAGARPGIDENWKAGRAGAGWPEPEERARCGWLEAYIASWLDRRAENAASAFDYAL